MKFAAGMTVAIGIALGGCAASVPTPPVGPHVDEEPAVVPFPPPPAHVEVVPSPPQELKAPVWIDGQWQWKYRRWVWQPGRWEEASSGAYYSPPTTVRLPDGTLVYYQGVWKGGAKAGADASAKDATKSDTKGDAKSDANSKANDAPNDGD